MDNITGMPVEGENFYGREHTVTQLQETLRHSDVLLLGPRRIGKTSVARAVIANVRAKNGCAIEVNVASCMDEQGFLDKLVSTLYAEQASATRKVIAALTEPLKTAAKRIKTLKISGVGEIDLSSAPSEAEDWTKIADDLLHLMAQTQENWLIYIDELPIFLFNIIKDDPQTGVRRVRRFLDWFRNDVRALPNIRNIRWLLSGSIGLDTLVQEHGMADTINSLHHQGLAPFSRKAAIAMLSQLAKDYDIQLSSRSLGKLVTAIQWPQPYYLQVAFQHLRSNRAANPKTRPGQLIEKAIDSMLQPGADNDFHHWQTRLSQQLNPTDAAHALALLHKAAQHQQGVRAETLCDHLHQRMGDVSAEQAEQCFIRLRDILQRDAYWFAEQNAGLRHYRFCLEPLRRWWLRRNTL